MKMDARSFILCLASFILSCGDAWALPAYSRLFQSKYAYQTSCALCHTGGGGSSTTPYGRDFLRAGANSQAFLKVEGKDSDQDGIPNLDEIKAKSNPGDAKSIPGQPGDWLSQATLVALPEKALKKLFPTADALSSLDGTLKGEQVISVERQLGLPLTDDDKVPTFYFASKGGKKFGVAQFTSAKTSAGLISIAVALDTSAVVTAVQILKNPGPKGIESITFLKQFAGKSLADKISVGEDIQPAQGGENGSKELALAVKKAVLTMNIVFKK